MGGSVNRIVVLPIDASDQEAKNMFSHVFNQKEKANWFSENSKSQKYENVFLFHYSIFSKILQTNIFKLN